MRFDHEAAFRRSKCPFVVKIQDASQASEVIKIVRLLLQQSRERISHLVFWRIHPNGAYLPYGIHPCRLLDGIRLLYGNFLLS